MLESVYQSKLIRRVERRFPGCWIEKNSTDFMQGLPDLTFYLEDWWAKLEVKAAWDAPERPNQRYYIEKFNAMSFAAFIYPENEEEVLDALQRSFETQRDARVLERQQLPLGQLRRGKARPRLSREDDRETRVRAPRVRQGRDPA